jgi:hypothetical protein
MDLYDAAIESFDPRMTAKRITEIFDEVKVYLPPLIRRYQRESCGTARITGFPLSSKIFLLPSSAAQCWRCSAAVLNRHVEPL